MIVGLLLTAFFSLLAFTMVELNHPEPILDLRLFKNSIYTLSIIISSVISFSLFGAIFLIPIYLQNTMGVSAMVSGLITLPSSLASGLMMPIAGRIFDKYGARSVSIVGLFIITVTTYMMHDFNLATPFAFITLIFTIRGLGMGLANMPVSTAGMNTVPLDKIGRASALGNVIRQVSASFGVAIFTTILQTREVFHFSNLADGLNMNSDQALALQRELSVIAVHHGVSFSTIQAAVMSNIGSKMALMAAVDSVDDCFIVAAVLCVGAMILCLFLKNKKSVPDVAVGMPVND
jgi:DHA2 family multidrug resistance protein